jgi:hypothetical protein
MTYSVQLSQKCNVTQMYDVTLLIYIKPTLNKLHFKRNTFQIYYYYWPFRQK